MAAVSPNSVVPPYNTTTGLIYLLELDYGTGAPATQEDLGVVAGKSVGAFREFYSTGAAPGTYPAMHSFASEDFTFPATDAEVPNLWYDGRINRAGTVSRSITLTAVDGPSYSTALGSIELTNGDGALDDFPDISTLVKSRATVKVGQRGAAHSSFQTLFTGIILGADVSLNTATLELGGVETLLEQPWFDQTYAGTGTVEGPAALAGTFKPYVLGVVFNMQPVLIEPLTYIFQAHAGGALDAISQVTFGGVPMIFDADYPTYAALAASAPAIGHYTTCRAQGLIKAGLTQDGVDGSFSLTASVSTHATATASVLARMVADAAQANLGVTYDVTAFNLMETQDPNFFYGRVLTEAVTYADVLSDLMRNMNRYWGINRAGSLTTSRLAIPPSAPSSGLVWDDADILEIDRLALPEGFRWPHDSRTARYRKNWSPQSNLAAIVTDPSFSVEYLSMTDTAAAPPANALTPAVVDTNLRTKTAATRLTNRLLALHGGQRFMYSVLVSILSGAPSLTESVEVYYDRFGLSAGKRLVVVASTEDYDAGTVLLTLWGG